MQCVMQCFFFLAKIHFSANKGWIDDCDFMSFSTVFQPYQDNRVVMKGRVQWNPFTIEKIDAVGRVQTWDH